MVVLVSKDIILNSANPWKTVEWRTKEEQAGVNTQKIRCVRFHNTKSNEV